jgi:hypothetical protein
MPRRCKICAESVGGAKNESRKIFMRDIDIHERGCARGMMHGQRDHNSSSPVLIRLGREVIPKDEKFTVSICAVKA